MVDEADRLLAQSFQDWLAQVLAATRVRPPTSVAQQPPSEQEQESIARQSNPLDSLLPDGLSPTLLDSLASYSIPSFFTEHKTTSCQKLLFSATLTRDPGKISALELRSPKYFIVQGSDANHPESNLMDVVTEKFSMPTTLTVRVCILIYIIYSYTELILFNFVQEYMIVSDPSEKPLVFFHLVHTRDITNALVFTKSAESTLRLVRLFDFFEAKRTQNQTFTPLVVRAYSSDLPSQERKSILEQFKNQKINM